MCQRMGWPPISTMGLGRTEVSSLRRVPRPPARMTAFIMGEYPWTRLGAAEGVAPAIARISMTSFGVREQGETRRSLCILGKQRWANRAISTTLVLPCTSLLAAISARRQGQFSCAQMTARNLWDEEQTRSANEHQRAQDAGPAEDRQGELWISCRESGVRG